MDIYAVIDELKILSDKQINVPRPIDSLISSYEENIGFVFSRDYKIFLKHASNIIYGALEPLLITDKRNDPRELETSLQEGRAIGLPEDLLPICEDNSDYYCLTKDNKVRFWSHDGTSNEEWPNLASWIKEVWIDGK